MSYKNSLPLTSIYGIIAELRTPLVEAKMLTEAGKSSEASEVIRHSLQLFDHFLYAQRLERRQEDMQYTACSLSQATENILQDIQPLARLYSVQLVFKPTTLRKANVSLVKQAFEAATYSLLYSLVSSLQNKIKSSLEIKIINGQKPTLRFFSPDIQLTKEQLHFKTNPRIKLNPHSSGIGSGIPLANLLYRQMGSHLSFIANQYGRGLGIIFKTTKQMSLMETLN